MNVGETIKCSDEEELIAYMQKLAMRGIETDFLYSKDGEKGLWLEVVKIEMDGDI